MKYSFIRVVVFLVPMLAQAVIHDPSYTASYNVIISNGAVYASGVRLANTNETEALRGATSVLNVATGALNQTCIDLRGATSVLNIATGALNQSCTDLRGATSVLNVATGALNSAVGLLNNATGNLNTAVGTLNNATGFLDTAVGNLNNATGNLNTVAGNLVAATGVLNTAVGSLNLATQHINSAKVSRSGDTMTGDLVVPNLYMTTNFIGTGVISDWVVHATTYVMRATSFVYSASAPEYLFPTNWYQGITNDGLLATLSYSNTTELPYSVAITYYFDTYNSLGVSSTFEATNCSAKLVCSASPAGMWEATPIFPSISVGTLATNWAEFTAVTNQPATAFYIRFFPVGVADYAALDGCEVQISGLDSNLVYSPATSNGWSMYSDTNDISFVLKHLEGHQLSVTTDGIVRAESFALGTNAAVSNWPVDSDLTTRVWTVETGKVDKATHAVVEVASSVGISVSSAGGGNLTTYYPATIFGTTDQSSARGDWFGYVSNVVEALRSPYEIWTYTNVPNAGGTCTLAYVQGDLIKIDAATNITLEFDMATYPSNGVNRVMVCAYSPTNSVAFATATISNEVTINISTTGWTRILFQRVSTNWFFYGRQ